MVSEFCFGHSLGSLYHTDLKSSSVQVFRQYLHSLHVVKAFPFVRNLNDFPYFIVKRLSHMVRLGQELDIVVLPL